MESALETGAVAFVVAGIAWFITVHVTTIVHAVRDRKRRRKF
jgi:hypothetical protein